MIDVPTDAANRFLSPLLTIFRWISIALITLSSVIFRLELWNNSNLIMNSACTFQRQKAKSLKWRRNTSVQTVITCSSGRATTNKWTKACALSADRQNYAGLFAEYVSSITASAVESPNVLKLHAPLDMPTTFRKSETLVSFVIFAILVQLYRMGESMMISSAILESARLAIRNYHKR